MRVRLLVLVLLALTFLGPQLTFLGPQLTAEASPTPIGGATLEAWDDVDVDGVVEPGTDTWPRSATTDNNGDFFFASVTLTQDTLIVLSMPLVWGPEESVEGALVTP